MTALSARLAEAKGNDSIDAVVERAGRQGHAIDRATVSRYVAGNGAKNPPDRVLRALAAGLGLDVRELRTLAGKPAGELGPWTPPDEAARLSGDQRKALDQLIKSIVREADHDNAPTTSQAPGSGAHKGQYGTAARRAPRQRTDDVGDGA
ncbi:helix-turn-helix domain-containing protein [Janibacter melonis]|uniref:helix-turn-helix domain-containing protein n=1 Tax=Janibacter melonis TaxID=262209 RepID=UPI00174A8638|nr:helix-turn-helix transcriptional regulator [Janibacter melonis]